MRYQFELKYRFELLVPLRDNEARPFSPVLIKGVRDALTDRFKGCRCQTLVPHLGTWKYRGKVYEENLLLFTVEAPRA